MNKNTQYQGPFTSTRKRELRYCDKQGYYGDNKSLHPSNNQGYI